MQSNAGKSEDWVVGRRRVEGEGFRGRTELTPAPILMIRLGLKDPGFRFQGPKPKSIGFWGSGVGRRTRVDAGADHDDDEVLREEDTFREARGMTLTEPLAPAPRVRVKAHRLVDHSSPGLRL